MKDVRDSYVQKLQNIKEMEDTKNWKKSFVFVTGRVSSESPKYWKQFTDSM